MRVAVLSDVHGNLEALQATLADIGAQGADDMLHLGDAVGYGPDPEACLDLLRERDITSLVGNHELGLIDAEELSGFNPQARNALQRTRELLSPAALEHLKDLPLVVLRHGARFVHGLPPESPTAYLFQPSPGELAVILHKLPEPISFVGHTHEPTFATAIKGEAHVQDLPTGETRLDPELRHIVGVGSVGQPRDGDYRAAWVLWDTDAHTVTLHRVEYDNRKTAQKIVDRGLDKRYADRLM